MEELIDSIRRRLGDGAYSNEAAVSISIVLPILRALG
jgi:predicted type IV restriction endonuclease